MLVTKALVGLGDQSGKHTHCKSHGLRGYCRNRSYAIVRETMKARVWQEELEVQGKVTD